MLNPSGIRVNSILPIMVKTDLTKLVNISQTYTNKMMKRNSFQMEGSPVEKMALKKTKLNRFFIRNLKYFNVGNWSWFQVLWNGWSDFAGRISLFWWGLLHDWRQLPDIGRKFYGTLIFGTFLRNFTKPLTLHEVQYSMQSILTQRLHSYAIAS